MPNYKVYSYERWIRCSSVTADSPEEAREKVVNRDATTLYCDREFILRDTIADWETVEVFDRPPNDIRGAQRAARPAARAHNIRIPVLRPMALPPDRAAEDLFYRGNLEIPRDPEFIPEPDEEPRPVPRQAAREIPEEDEPEEVIRR